MTTIKITVTKDILEKSCSCGYGDTEEINKNCAISLAIRDIFPEAIVEEKGIFITPIDWESRLRIDDYDIRLPKKAKDFIQHFDGADYFEILRMPEISFKIRVPNKVIDKINIEELRPLLQNHPTLELI